MMAKPAGDALDTKADLDALTTKPPANDHSETIPANDRAVIKNAKPDFKMASENNWQYRQYIATKALHAS